MCVLLMENTEKVKENQQFKVIHTKGAFHGIVYALVLGSCDMILKVNWL